MVQKDSIANYDCIIVVGPTAVGKSAYAIDLAKKYNGEIINADSQQVYKDLNIGTAKVTPKEMQGIKHHLIDCISSHKEFSVAEFKNQAIDCINEIKSRGKMPIIVGGTGFYVQSLLYDLSYGNTTKNTRIRNKYANLCKKYGNEYIYNILKEKDAARAMQLHPNDTKRVIRALEILSSGQTPSKVTKHKTDLKAYVIMLNMDRAKLYERINARVDKMIKQGLDREVKKLLDNGITFDNQCMQAIGYKEWKGYFEQNTSFADTVELIKKHTRHYAKRQITWFKNSLECDEIININ